MVLGAKVRELVSTKMNEVKHREERYLLCHSTRAVARYFDATVLAVLYISARSD